MIPRNLAEARAECVARKLGPSACMDLIAPFCGAGENPAAELDVDNGLAFCKREQSIAPAQARVILNEAQARARAAEGPPWLLIGGGVAVGALVLYLVLRWAETTWRHQAPHGKLVVLAKGRSMMSLFFCAWLNRASLLVDECSIAGAIAIATKVAGGVAPKTVRLLPAGAFVAEVFDDEDANGEALLVVEPLPHVADLLAELEDSSEDVATAQAVALVPGKCGSEADADAGIVVCELVTGHDGQHAGGGMVWA